MAEDEAQLLRDSVKWPWSERVSHSSWKIRSAAYDDIRAACNGIYDEQDPLLSEFSSLFVKAVADSNAAAQDKALDALNAYLLKATEQHVAKSVDKTCTNIVSKSLNGRSGTVQRATEVLLNFVELEQSSAVVDALLQGFNNKVPKVVVASLDVLIQAISLFGTKVIIPQPIIKAVPNVADSKDGKAREKAKELVVELSRWVGPDLIRTALFKDMRDAMKGEIENGMQAVVSLGRPKPERFTRKEQAKQAALRAQQEGAEGSQGGQHAAEGDAAGAAHAEAAEEAAAEVDPYDVADPRNVLPELKKEWWEALESKKWSDRKGSLTQLKELCTYPRLASGRDVDYGDVNRELRKVITKDSNVACVAEAISVCAAMASGLRSAYSATAKGLVEVLLEKYKEKNAGVTKAVTDALTNMHKHCFALLDVAETTAAALGHANPKVKEEVLLWLQAEVSREAKPALSKLAPMLLPPAVKCAGDATPSLREAAVGFMVAFATQFGNAAVLDKFTGTMDEGRKKRLGEMLAEAGGKPSAAAAQPASTTGRAPSSPGPAPTRAPAKPSAAAAALAASRAKPGVGASKVAKAVSSSTSAGAAGPAAAKKVAKDPDGDDEASLASGSLSRDEAHARFSDLFGEATVKQLQDDQWKTRLDAMDAVAAKAADGSLSANCSTVVQSMAHLPGWGEKNFQVMAKQFEVIRVLASTAPGFSKRDAYVAICGLVDKMSDLKLKGPSFDTLVAIAEAVGPGLVASLLHKKGVAHKNPKILSEVCNWIAQAAEEFGLAAFNVKALIDWAKEGLGSANAGVRNSVIQMLGVMHSFLGPPLGDMIRADVKPALMAAIEGEFAKRPKNPAHMPTRTSRADTQKRGAAASTHANGGAAAGPAPRSPAAGGDDGDDLLPRTDISASITGALLDALGGANWKDRKQALDDIEGLLTSAGGRIQPQVGDLMSALKARMTDSNKNLVSQALILLGKLARAMGKPIDRQARMLLTPALKNISDNKSTVRAAVVDMMDAWASVAPFDSLISELMAFLTSAKCTADGKADGIQWLATQAAAGRAEGALSEFMKAVALGAGDKAAEVRDATAKLMAGLLEKHAPAELNSAAGVLEGPQRKAALEALAKATGGAVPTAAAPASASSRPSTAPSAALRSSVNGRPSSAAGLGSTLSRAPSVGVRSSLTLNKQPSGAGAVKAAAPDAADDGPLILPDNKKEERARKGKFRPNKLEVRPDEAATLEAEFAPLLSGHLKGLLFHKDFKKQCEAADAVRNVLPTLYDRVYAVVDLLFRWCTLRIVEGNTQVLVKVLDMLKDLLGAMEVQGHKLSDFEAKLILPVLVEKAGHNQDKIKADHRELLRRAALVYPPVRVAAFIKDGLESKNNKTRVACVEELGALIDRYGPSLYTTPIATQGPTKGSAPPEGLLATLARLAGERDNALRSAALSGLEQAYMYEGEGLWQFLGKTVDTKTIAERLKHADKSLAKQGLRAGYRGSGGGNMEEGSPVGNLSVAVPPNGTNSRPTTPRTSLTPTQRPPSPSALGRRGSGSSAGTSIPGGAAVAGGSSSGGGRAVSGAGSHADASILATASRAAPALPSHLPVRHVSEPNHGGLEHSSSAHASAADTAATMAYLRSSSALPAGAAAAAAANALGAMSVVGSHALSAGGAAVGAPGPAVAGMSPMSSLSKADEADMRRDFRRCMVQLAGPDIEESVQVMKLLCYELMDTSSSPMVLTVFKDNIEELVDVLARKTDQIFAAAGDAIARHEAPNARACKYALNTLMNIVQSPNMAQVISEGRLRTLVSVLLCCLLDERVGALQEGMAMLKALNLLMMKVLENCDRTAVFGALLHLLLSPHERLLVAGEAEKMESRWYDLVVKCTIKVTKSLPQTIEQINLKALLLYVHKFFDALGGEEIRRRGAREDKPLRMVKTVLHEICKIKGHDIYTYTTDIPGADLDPALKPIIFPYIDLNLQTLGLPAPARAVPAGVPAASVPSRLPSAGQSHLPGHQAPAHVLGVNTNALNTANASVPRGPPTPTQKPSIAPSTRDAGADPAHRTLAPSGPQYSQQAADENAARAMLGAIFKRIADPAADRQQALIDLHFFSQANPDTDIQGMLSSTSETFRGFILKGLHKVQQVAVQQQQAAKQAQQPVRPPPEPSAAWSSPDGEVSVRTSGREGADGERGVPAVPSLALLRLGKQAANSEDATGSGLSSPSVIKTNRAAPVVGEDRMAMLRDRMHAIVGEVASMPIPQRAASLSTSGGGAGGLPSPGSLAGGGRSSASSIADRAAVAEAPAQAQLKAEKAQASPGNLVFGSPAGGKAGPATSLADLQERLRMLKAQDA